MWLQLIAMAILTLVMVQGGEGDTGSSDSYFYVAKIVDQSKPGKEETAEDFVLIEAKSKARALNVTKVQGTPAPLAPARNITATVSILVGGAGDNNNNNTSSSAAAGTSPPASTAKQGEDYSLREASNASRTPDSENSLAPGGKRANAFSPLPLAASKRQHHSASRSPASKAKHGNDYALEPENSPGKATGSTNQDHPPTSNRTMELFPPASNSNASVPVFASKMGGSSPPVPPCANKTNASSQARDNITPPGATTASRSKVSAGSVLPSSKPMSIKWKYNASLAVSTQPSKKDKTSSDKSQSASKAKGGDDYSMQEDASKAPVSKGSISSPRTAHAAGEGGSKTSRLSPPTNHLVNKTKAAPSEDANSKSNVLNSSSRSGPAASKAGTTSKSATLSATTADKSSAAVQPAGKVTASLSASNAKNGSKKNVSGPAKSSEKASSDNSSNSSGADYGLVDFASVQDYKDEKDKKFFIHYGHDYSEEVTEHYDIPAPTTLKDDEYPARAIQYGNYE